MSIQELATNPIPIFFLGIGLSCIGYGPLSLKKNPTAGIAFAGIGFLCRLAGPILLLWPGFWILFSISMAWPMKQ